MYDGFGQKPSNNFQVISFRNKDIKSIDIRFLDHDVRINTGKVLKKYSATFHICSQYFTTLCSKEL